MTTMVKNTVTVPVSLTLAQMMQGMTDKSKEFVIKQLYHYMNEYERVKRSHGALNAIYSFHRLIEDELAHAKESGCEYHKRIACKKGCGFCCMINVDVNEDEVDLLIDFCKKKNISIDIDRLRLQSVKTSETWKELKGTDRHCVFLDTDMTCKVYEMRPSACRKFSSLDTVKYCEEDKNEVHAIYGNLLLEILQVVIYRSASTESMSKHLYSKLKAE